LCCLSKLIEQTFVLIIKWLVFCVVWASWLNGFDCFVEHKTTLCCTLNDLIFVLFKQIDWTYFCVDHLITRLLCCLSKLIKRTDWLFCCKLNYFCVVWAKWLNRFDCFVECKMTWLFVLYVKWLDLTWPSRDTRLWWAEICDCNEQRYAILMSSYMWLWQAEIRDCDKQRYANVTSRYTWLWWAEIRNCDKQIHIIVMSRDMWLWWAEIRDWDEQRYAIVMSRDTWLWRSEKLIKWTDFCVVWAKWLNRFDCFVERKTTRLFVLYVKRLDFCVVWANWLNRLLCWTLNDSLFVLFQQVIEWTDFCVVH
jgi:hypothetical protein